MPRRFIPEVSARREWAVIVIASAIKLWLTAAIRIGAIGYANHDDQWFLHTAHSILQGNWLGDYTHMTLIKGPGYPLWIAFVSSLGIPLLLAQQVLYVLACLAVCSAISPAVSSRGARLCLFLALLFNPMTYCDETATRVIREGIYPALALLVFAAVAGAVLRLEAPRRDLLSWLFLGGTAFAAFWETREEGIWIGPLLGAAAVILLLWIRGDRKMRWRRAALVVGIPAVIFATAHGAIIVTNGIRYDAFTVVELKQNEFVRAYGSLTNIRHHGIPRVPVPKEARERAYAASPAFARLRPFLDGPLGDQWAKQSWRDGHGDIGGGSFMWALRDAVAAAGYYDLGARTARAYYKRVARELDEARREGRLNARPARASMLPPLLTGERLDVARTWWRGLIRMATMSDFDAQPAFSDGTDAELREFADVTWSQLAPRAKKSTRFHLIGWALHTEGPVDIRIEGPDRSQIPDAIVIRQPSNDVYEMLARTGKAFPPARHARFEAWVPAGEAFMVFSRHGTLIDWVPVTPDGFRAKNPQLRLNLDSFNIEIVERPPLRPLDAWRLSVLRGIGKAYSRVFPWLLGLSVLLYGGLRLRRRDRTWTSPLLIAGLLGAIALRLVILSLIEVTSFPAIHRLYLSPGQPLLILAALWMAHDAVIVFVRRRTVSSTRL